MNAFFLAWMQTFSAEAQWQWTVSTRHIFSIVIIVFLNVELFSSEYFLFIDLIKNWNVLKTKSIWQLRKEQQNCFNGYPCYLVCFLVIRTKWNAQKLGQLFKSILKCIRFCLFVEVYWIGHNWKSTSQLNDKYFNELPS